MATHSAHIHQHQSQPHINTSIPLHVSPTEHVPNYTIQSTLSDINDDILFTPSAADSAKSIVLQSELHKLNELINNCESMNKSHIYNIEQIRELYDTYTNVFKSYRTIDHATQSKLHTLPSTTTQYMLNNKIQHLYKLNDHDLSSDTDIWTSEQLQRIRSQLLVFRCLQYQTPINNRLVQNAQLQLDSNTVSHSVEQYQLSVQQNIDHRMHELQQLKPTDNNNKLIAAQVRKYKLYQLQQQVRSTIRQHKMNARHTELFDIDKLFVGQHHIVDTCTQQQLNSVDTQYIDAGTEPIQYKYLPIVNTPLTKHIHTNHIELLLQQCAEQSSNIVLHDRCINELISIYGINNTIWTYLCNTYKFLHRPYTLLYNRYNHIRINKPYIEPQINHKLKQKYHKYFIQCVLSHVNKFDSYHARIHKQCYKLANTGKSHIQQLQSQHQQQLERQQHTEQLQRIELLKSNDMAAYTELIQNTRNNRINILLDKTNEFLQSIQTKITRQQQQHDNNSNNGGTDASKDTSESHINPSEAHQHIFGHVLNESITTQPISLTGGTLQPYQLFGIEFLVSLYNNQLNGILADEMGLGKTIQTIGLISYLIDKYMTHCGIFLIIVPLSTIHNWIYEIHKWNPSLIVCEYIGSKQYRSTVLKQYVNNKQYNVLLTTFDYIISDVSVLSKLQYEYIILDEGHRIKNIHSKLNQLLHTRYHTLHKLILTGTPLQNNLSELFHLFNYLNPNIFNCTQSFQQWFNIPFQRYGITYTSDDTDELVSVEERLIIVHRLHQILQPFVLRRLKSDVLKQLPTKIERVIKIPCSVWQKKLYDRVVKQYTQHRNTSNHHKHYGYKKSNFYSINNSVIQLRKIVNHPYLCYRSIDEYYSNQPLIIRSSGKISTLHNILYKLKYSNHRVLLFCQMTRMLDIIEEYIQYVNYDYLRLDGTCNNNQRKLSIEQFNAPDSQIFIFLLSTRAGGLGLNLQSADTVILYDSDYNPQQDLQAQDRAHRIGQINQVHVYRLITTTPIEQSIYNTTQHKLHLDQAVIQSGRFDAATTNDQRKQLLADVLSHTVEQSLNDIPSASQLNELLARNDSEYELYEQLDQKLYKELQLQYQKYYKTTNKTYDLLVDDSELYDIDQGLLVSDNDESSSSSGTEHNDNGSNIHSGRNKRQSTRQSLVDLSDILTERQYLQCIERGDDPHEIAQEKYGKLHNNNNPIDSTDIEYGDTKPDNHKTRHSYKHNESKPVNKVMNAFDNANNSKNQSKSKSNNKRLRSSDSSSIHVKYTSHSNTNKQHKSTKSVNSTPIAPPVSVPDYTNLRDDDIVVGDDIVHIDSVLCEICHIQEVDDDPLLCDGCNRAYHLRCLKLHDVPGMLNYAVLYDIK